MNKIRDILNKPDTVVFFDIDGTLTSYNYGEYHAHHELDYTPEFRDVNIYADCIRLKPLYDYIQSHDKSRLYCISKEPHGHEAWKSDMVERLYGIPASHCFYTLDSRKKPQIVMDKVKELFPGIDPKSVVLMDDNDETLGLYMKETPFCTAHPMLFMEDL